MEFQFCTKLDQTILLGLHARNATELLDGIRNVPKASIYYHTHRFLQQHHYLSPEPPNDFAYWVSEVLNDSLLGEMLSSIDTIQFNSIADLRTSLVEVIGPYVQPEGRGRQCPPGEEFHFMAARTFVLKTAYVAHDLVEFVAALEKVSINSLYYHMFDSRLRLGQSENDFSAWLAELGKPQLADEVRELDPYTHTLEGLRQKVLTLVNRHDRH